MNEELKTKIEDQEEENLDTNVVDSETDSEDLGAEAEDQNTTDTPEDDNLEQDNPELDAPQDASEIPGDEMTEQAPEAEKTLTQSQVNELVGRARQEGRESALKELLNRYGVSAESEMDDMFGKGQAYGVLNDEYASVNNSYKQVMAENALLKSQIDVNRWDDVKLILNGNGLEVTTENIESMLPSHPEWRGAVQPVAPDVNGDATQTVKPAVIRKLGSDLSSQQDTISEEEQFKKLFGFN